MTQLSIFDTGTPIRTEMRGRPKGYVCSADTRSKMSRGIRAAKQQARPAWRPEQDALLGKGPDRIVAIVLRKTLAAVTQRRCKLGIQAYRATNRRTLSHGYCVVTLSLNDPLLCMARSGRQVLEHRLVMARALGRPLTTDEIVHHRNGRRDDNRLENLELWTRAHPDGQRIDDVLAYCREMIARYTQQPGEKHLIFNG
jgi:hypothetical protein